jgi:hypothetical protein
VHAFSVKKINLGYSNGIFCIVEALVENCKDHLLTVSNTNFKIYGNEFNQLENSDSGLYIRSTSSRVYE